MAPATLERVAQIGRQAQPASRISLTDLSRSRKWRDDLCSCGVIEVIDHSETAAWLLSDADMALLLDTIDSLLEEVEALQVKELLDARSGRNAWLGGEELAAKAKASLENRKNAVKKALDGE